MSIKWWMLASPSAARMGVLLAIQQISVGASIVLLARLARDAGEAHFDARLFGAFLFTIVFPYFPGGLALVERRRWELEIERNFLNRGSAELFGRTGIWSSREQRDVYTSIYAKESTAILYAFSTWAYTTCANCLNALLSIAAIAWAVDTRFLGAYAVGIVLAAWLLKAQSPRINRLADQSQRTRIGLSAALLDVWDNTTLGNRSCYNNWRSAMSNRFESSRAAGIRESAVANFVSVGIALVTFVPTLIVVVWGVVRQGHERPYLMALIVTLPRLFQILVASHALLSSASEWNAHRAKLAILAGFFAPPPSADLLGRIHFEAIRTSPAIVPLALEAVEAALATPVRITLRGPNGSGKTSLLLLLKSRLGDRAFYLPTHHHLRILPSSTAASTGESVARILEHVQRVEPAPVILLDEWDANLDSTNRDRLSKLIDDLARTRAVIEVRHGQTKD